MENEVISQLQDAARLLAEGKGPVELSRLCSGLGIKIERETSASKDSKSKRAFLLSRGDDIAILLPRASSATEAFTAWERFLIAHELGHYFLNRLRTEKPYGQREYWQTEHICDDFARRLLLPRAQVLAITSVVAKSAVGMLDLIKHLQEKWNVTWPTAALEVSQCVPGLYFFRVISQPSAQGDRLRVSLSTLNNKRRAGLVIPRDSALSGLLRNCALGTTETEPGMFDEFLGNERKALEAAVLAVGNEYRISVLASEPPEAKPLSSL